MIDYTKKSLLLSLLTLCFLIPNIAISSLKDLETTRLKATAGAGVGSILMDEASILNPAPIAFFNMGAVYFQKSGSSITQQNNSSYEDNGQLVAIISDAKGSVGGSISYQKYNVRFDERERLAASIATPMGKRSSIGVTYRRTKDRLSEEGRSYREDNFNQFVFGVSHAVSESFTTD